MSLNGLHPLDYLFGGIACLGAALLYLAHRKLGD